MNKFWSDRINNMEPYVPGEQPKEQKFIKLNTNENPYPPSPKAIAAANEAAGGGLRLYPDPDSSELIDALADFYGLRKEQIFVGNGSDEVLAFCFPAFFNTDGEIVFADITYSFYPVYAKLYGIPYRNIPLNDDYTLPVDEYCKPNHGVLIANPNAPTSIEVPIGDIEKILKANPDNVVIIDEAYVDFGGTSAVGLIDSCDNLLVVQTFSKSRALAGLRVGFAMGSENLIAALNAVKNSFNSYTLDKIAIKTAAAAVRDREYFDAICSKVVNTREKTIAELRAIGCDIPDSKTNFMFVSHPRVHASELYSRLREKGILVRYFNKPRLDNRLRISVGTDEDMEILVREFKEIVGG